MDTEMSHARKPWIATSLSLLCPGLGQIYCGQAGRGIVIFCSSLILGPLLVLTAIFSYWTPALIAFFAILVGSIVLLNWYVRDAARLARRLVDTAYQPQDFNHPLVYTLMIFSSVPYVVGLALFFRATMIEAFVIPSSSMSPTFLPGDRVLVSKWGLHSATLDRGDIVVFRNPVNRKQNFVKRIIGLPGETVEIKDGAVIIDGHPLEKKPSPKSDDTVHEPESSKTQTFIERAGKAQYLLQVDNAEVPLEMPPVKVAPDAYFVLGDHRDHSLDSREIGNVPHGLVIGTVQCIYFPARTWRRFGRWE